MTVEFSGYQYTNIKGRGHISQLEKLVKIDAQCSLVAHRNYCITHLSAKVQFHIHLRIVVVRCTTYKLFHFVKHPFIFPVFLAVPVSLDQVYQNASL